MKDDEPSYMIQFDQENSRTWGGKAENRIQYEQGKRPVRTVEPWHPIVLSVPGMVAKAGLALRLSFVNTAGL